MSCCTQPTQLSQLHKSMLSQPVFRTPLSFDTEGQQISRVLQPKMSNVAPEQAGMYGTAYSVSAVTSKALSQPVKAARPFEAEMPTSLSDTAFELHDNMNAGDESGPAAALNNSSEDSHPARTLSIPGQVELHEYR